MYKYRISTNSPWWTKNNQNVPNKMILEKWINDNMTDVNNLTINFIDIKSLKLNSKYDDIKYIEQTNTDTNEKRYYYVNNIEKIGGNNAFIYNCLIDIYTSFTINFIEKNKEKELIFIRTHEYSNECLEINDDNIISLPKFYKNFYFQKVPFNYDESNKIWYSDNLGLSGDDLLNANKYYVFKDGFNGGYKFFPILSKDLQANVHYKQNIKGNLISTDYFYNGKYNKDEKQEILPALNKQITDAYESNKIVEYSYQNVSYGYKFPAHTVWLNGWTKMNTNYGTYPISISAYNTNGNNAGAGLKYIDYNIYLYGNLIYHKNYINITSSKHEDIDVVGSEGRKFRVQIFDSKPKYVVEKVNNSLTKLEEYRKKESNINKFLGIYYLPHFLNFSKFEKEDGYIFITIKPTGDNINFFNIFNYELSNVDYKLNNTSYSTPYLLKFLQIKYYGNLINTEYRINNEHKIYIGGKIFFTDTCSIISKSSELIDLSKSIITYPYQLPIGIDEYEKYVKANRSSTETSFNIFKQQQEMNFANSIFNGAKSFISGGIDAGIGLASGNVKKLGSGIEDIIDAPLNTTGSIINQIQAGKHHVMKIKQQYNQANLTIGNNVQFSNINNASLIHYYDSEDEQFEGVEISDLDDNSLAMINNYILLNGYFLTKKDTFKNRIENNRKFNFIQIDSQLLNEQLNINNDYINEIYEYIYEQLTNGIRIWNIENINDIPEFDDDNDWIDQPSDIIPPITPPQPPIELRVDIKFKITNNELMLFSSNSDMVRYEYNRSKGLFYLNYFTTSMNMIKLKDLNNIYIKDNTNLKNTTLYIEIDMSNVNKLTDDDASDYLIGFTNLDFDKTNVYFINVSSDIVQKMKKLKPNQDPYLQEINVYINGDKYEK